MRTEQEVINDAIQENRIPEYLLYGVAILFVLTGEALIGAAIYNREALDAIAGVALNGLGWPAYRAIREIRHNNMMMRLLEVPLSKAESEEEAARMLIELFLERWKSQSSNDPLQIGKGRK